MQKKYLIKTSDINGFALPIALILLFVVTLLGVSSLRLNLMSEQMTRNSIQRQQAFEAAEVALLAGEADVEVFGNQIANAAAAAFSTVGSGDRQLLQNCEFVIGATPGVCSPAQYHEFFDTNLAYDHWVNLDGDVRNRLDVWDQANRHRTVNDIETTRLGLVEAPKYIIEFMGFETEEGEHSTCAANSTEPLDANESRWPFCSTDNKTFRITALGTAGNLSEARVMLQSIYIID